IPRGRVLRVSGGRRALVRLRAPHLQPRRADGQCIQAEEQGWGLLRELVRAEHAHHRSVSRADELSAFAALAEHGATPAAVAPPQLKAPAYRRWSCSGTNRLHRFRSALAAAKARPLGPAVLDLPDPLNPPRRLAARH